MVLDDKNLLRQRFWFSSFFAETFITCVHREAFDLTRDQHENTQSAFGQWRRDYKAQITNGAMPKTPSFPTFNMSQTRITMS
jgi:hypothetical protein